MFLINFRAVSFTVLMAAFLIFSACSNRKQEIRRLKSVVRGLIRQVNGPAEESLANAVSEKVRFKKVVLKNSTDRHSSITVGPDGKLYASTIDGRIKRFAIKPDGTLEDPEVIYSLQDASGKRTPRLTIGFTFDPAATADNLIAWVTNSTFTFSGGPNWDGKLTRLSGSELQNVQDVLIHLPRSAKDHLTNSIAFGPDNALYFTQGSNTAMGGPDKTWENREEHLLSGTVLRLDVSKLDMNALPLDVKTAEGGNYNPYAAQAPLTIFATGIRNAYDLLWHSNGQLYVPTNGSDAGGSMPAAVPGTRLITGAIYNGPKVAAVPNVKQIQKDYLFRVVKGGYYGHPNPVRGEYVMNGGNPTASLDSAQVDEYPVGTLPDWNWRGFAFEFAVHASPNGIIEYKNNAFNGELKGKILVLRYINNMDILVLEPGGEKKDIVKQTEGSAIAGFWAFFLPLDLTEDVRTGNIYVAEFGGEGQITLLQPVWDSTAMLSVKQ